jgi:hypothetical protein
LRLPFAFAAVAIARDTAARSPVFCNAAGVDVKERLTGALPALLKSANQSVNLRRHHRTLQRHDTPLA